MPPELMLFISTYGYLGVFLGCLIEGEALVVIAGFLAYQGNLFLPYVLLAAFFGTLANDIGWFAIGRYSSEQLLTRFRSLQFLSTHSVIFVNKRPRLITLFFRFMYGFRIIIPFSLGKTKLSFTTYLVYSALGVWLWVAVYVGIGYFFASAIEVFFGQIKDIGIIIALVVIGTIVCFSYGHHVAEKILRKYSKS